MGMSTYGKEGMTKSKAAPQAAKPSGPTAKEAELLGVLGEVVGHLENSGQRDLAITARARDVIERLSGSKN